MEPCLLFSALKLGFLNYLSNYGNCFPYHIFNIVSSSESETLHESINICRCWEKFLPLKKQLFLDPRRHDQTPGNISNYLACWLQLITYRYNVKRNNNHNSFYSTDTIMVRLIKKCIKSFILIYNYRCSITSV